jgi:hypothetical protein
MSISVLMFLVACVVADAIQKVRRRSFSPAARDSRANKSPL